MYEKYKRSRQRRAGRRYEYFVAQTLRQEGWYVDENGRNGVNDHGIDLIAMKDGIRRYIQCKGFKRTKFIHEDVVSHLLGSVAAIEGIDNLEAVEMYLYSPAQLDNYAEVEAERLRIHFVQLNYPKWHRRHSYFHQYQKHKAYSHQVES